VVSEDSQRQDLDELEKEIERILEER